MLDFAIEFGLHMTSWGEMCFFFHNDNQPFSRYYFEEKKKKTKTTLSVTFLPNREIPTHIFF